MNRLFAFVWRHRMEEGDRVVRVRGWRTALIDPRCGGRVTAMWMFRWNFWQRNPYYHKWI